LSRTTLFAGVLLACFLMVSRSSAQSLPGNLYDFGDSFQDANYWCSRFGTPLGACSNNRNTPMQLATVSDYAFAKSNDFAIGATGSGSGTIANAGYPPYPGYTTTYPNMTGQIAEFQALGNRIAANDLVMLTYAGNDATVYGNVGPALAAATVGNLTTNIQTLVTLGARNFILFGGLPFDLLPAGGPSMLEQDGISPAADRAYYTTLNATLPAAIAPFESTGLHVRILDANTLYMRALDTPSLYGFVYGDCALIAGCTTAPLAVQDQYAFYNAHPSQSFALVLARYIENLLTMPYQIAAEAELGQAAALAFHETLEGRLNADHLLLAGSGQDGAGKPAVGRVSLFGSGNYAYADRNDRTGASGGSGQAGGMTIGAEYRVMPNLLLGLAFSYSDAGSALDNSSGKIGLDAYQFAGFASLNYPNWFVDGVLNGGVNTYTVKRSGVIDQLSGNPEGNSIVAGLTGGYLFDVSPVQVGPIAGLTYAHVGVGSYSESGDIVLAQAVGGQSLDSLTGSAGLQLRYAGAVYGRSLRTFMNLTADHDFLGGSRVITTTGLDPTSAVPVFTPVSSGSATYGRISVGVDVDVLANLAVGIMGGTTFARATGNQGQAELTLKLSF
jgi:uncharacterized protein YhjY with autotransporter beta-barrel domain/phospholipase/lecithinase/hemolysin